MDARQQAVQLVLELRTAVDAVAEEPVERQRPLQFRGEGPIGGTQPFPQVFRDPAGAAGIGDIPVQVPLQVAFDGQGVELVDVAASGGKQGAEGAEPVALQTAGSFDANQQRGVRMRGEQLAATLARRGMPGRGIVVAG
jgi:hypothetical protein